MNSGKNNLNQEDALFAAISLLKNVEEVKLFFKDLCTPAEIQAMTDRWRVVDPIKQGIPYRTIHQQTGVSVSTVGRVARYIAHGAGGYDLLYKRVKRKSKNEK